MGTFDAIHWRMGDGTTFEGEQAFHTYTKDGVYTITVELRNFALSGDTGLVEVPENLTQTRLQGFYTLCSEPMPEFEIVDKGGLRYDIVNLTPVTQPRCISTLDWSVKRQGRDRELLEFDTWEPSFDLPDEGTYVVSATMVGMAGEATTEFVLDAEYNLTSDYYRVFAQACSTAPASSGLGLLVLLAVTAGRRRRR